MNRFIFVIGLLCAFSAKAQNTNLDGTLTSVNPIIQWIYWSNIGNTNSQTWLSNQIAAINASLLANGGNITNMLSYTNFAISSSPATSFTGTPTALGPVITIPANGNYILSSAVNVGYSGIASLGSVNILLMWRKTSGTPAYVASSTNTYPLGTLGALALPFPSGDCSPFAVRIDGAQSNDTYQVYGVLTGSLSLGSIKANAVCNIIRQVP